jgi:hypothetical protein
MNTRRSQITRALTKALAEVETFDGEAFTYDGVKAVGVFGLPDLDVEAMRAGTRERITATLTVRRAWFRRMPRARLPDLLVRPGTGAKYFVASINTDDLTAYQFDLIDRANR